MTAPFRRRTPRAGRTRRAQILAALLAGSCLAPFTLTLPAHAQDATWLPNAVDGDFSNPANWSSGAIPTGTAFFGPSTQTTIGNTLNATLDALVFNAGASAYNLNDSSFALNGAGIVNNSSNVQTFDATALVFFSNSATAGNANVNFVADNFVFFQDSTSAGSANIVNNSSVTFSQTATGGNATITTANGATTEFHNNSTAGNAQLITNTGGVVDFSATSGPLGDNKISAGSIAGDGTYRLGANQLTVGGNNLSTTVSGVIQDGGSAGGTGASLVKTGTGILTLSGTNTYTGGTAVTGGLVNFTSAANFGTGSITLNGGGLQWASGTTTDISARLAALGSGGGTFDTNGNDVTLAGSIGGAGRLTKTGAGTLTLSSANTYTGGTAIVGGTISINDDAQLGAAGGALVLTGGTLQITNGVTMARPTTLGTGGGTFDLQGNALTVNSVISGAGGLTLSSGGLLVLAAANTYTGGTVVSGGVLQMGVGGLLPTNGALALNGGDMDLNGQSQTVGALSGTGGTIFLNGATLTTNSAVNSVLVTRISGPGALVKQGAGTLTLTATNNNYTLGTTVSGGLINFGSAGNFGSGSITLNGGGLQWATGTSLDISARRAALGGSGGTFDTNANSVTLASAITGAGGLTKTGLGTLTLSGTNTYGGGTTINGGVLSVAADANLGAASGGLAFGGGALQTTTSFTTARNTILNAGGGIVSPASGTTLTVNGTIGGSGGLTKAGLGTLSLTGNNSYTGGTTVSAGALQGTTSSLQGNIANNATVIFNQAGNGTYAGSMSGTGGVGLAGGGVLTVTGTNTYTGPTTVTGSGIVVNGSLTSAVTLDSASFIGGNGTIGGLTVNGGTLSPGNSIGLLTVNGSYAQNGGTYALEINPQGQSDRVTVNGTAILNGGTVQLVAASGTYGISTTYTILSATGGVSGAYSGATSTFAFLTPSLSYTANNVLLTLALQGNGFLAFNGTPNQRAVAGALNQAFATASGDFATVIGALASLTIQQAGPALTAISGQPYADTGTATVGASLLFLNTLGQQIAVARGKGSPGTRIALAEACDVACDEGAPQRLSAWMSGVGGLGSVGSNGDVGTLTYNFGGAAAGLDWRFDPRFLVGVAVSYTSGRQWVDGFSGMGNSDSYSAALYASFTQSGFYADVMAGYAYADTRTQRAMTIPELQPRMANGQAGTNQFLGQLEAGYGVGIYAPAQAVLTPFARFQTVAAAQNGFSESGSANALNLIVAPQNTTSVRTVLGADLAGNVPVGGTNPLSIALRLGWAHEYADTARSMTASFQGAPSAAFTVYGASLQRDAAVIGFGLETRLAPATLLYARYDGEIAGRDNAHAGTAGLRLSW